jgi:hypothetical protein
MELSASNRKPLARSKELVVEELKDELLVYDLKSDHAHCLGVTAARVWRACDGNTSVEALAATLDLDSDTVARSLDELAACDLLDAGPELGAGWTRRELTVRVAKVGAAAAAVPLIVSVTAPSPAEAQTPTVEQCGGHLTHGCGECVLSGCCCCEQAGGEEKNCVPTQSCGAPGEFQTGHCSKTNA